MAKEFDPSKLSDKQLQSGFGGKDAQGVAQLAAQIKEQNKIAQDKKTDKERNDKLDELIKTTKFGDSEGKKTALALKQQFKESQERLAIAQADGDEKLIKLEEKNQESILSGADDLEKSREAEKQAGKQFKLLEGIKGGIGNLASKFKDNATFLAGLTGVALAVFDPKKLKELFPKAVDVVVAAIDLVTKLVQGDFSGALEIFKENFKEFGLVIGLIAAFKFAEIVATIVKIGQAFGVLKSGLASLLAPIAIPVAIIAAIALGIYAIIESFKVFQQKFEETGSAFEAIKAFIIELPTQIFGTLLNLIKGAVGFVVGIFSPDIGEAIADFDFKEVLRNLITGMFNFVQNIGSAIKNFFTESIPNAIDNVLNSVKSIFDGIVERFKVFGRFVKGIGLGSVAAIKAALPGGESPKEAFTRKFNSVMNSGSSSTRSGGIDAVFAGRGDQMNDFARQEREAQREVDRRGREIKVNNVDNSTKTTNNTNTAITSSSRERGYDLSNAGAF